MRSTPVRQRTASAAVASPVTSMSHTVATATPARSAVGSAAAAAISVPRRSRRAGSVAKVRSSSLTR